MATRARNERGVEAHATLERANAVKYANTRSTAGPLSPRALSHAQQRALTARGMQRFVTSTGSYDRTTGGSP